MKKLYKSKKNKMIAGICGGIGEYFNVDPTFVRLVFVFLGGILPYVIACILVPDEPFNFDPNNTQK